MTTSDHSSTNDPAMRPHHLPSHDEARIDEYFWMRERDSEEVRNTIHVPGLWEGQRDPNSVYAHEGVAVGTNMKKSNPDYVLVLVLRFWPAGDDPEQSREEK